MTAIAHVPSNAAIAYLGAADGGVWKTTDSGAHWSPLFDRQPSLSIGSIAVDPQAQSTVYVGTGEANLSTSSYFGAGIYRSTTGGASWSRIGGTNFTNCYVGKIVVQPGSSSTLFASAVSSGKYNTSSSCVNGLYRSIDSGATWSRVITGQATDVVVKPGTPTTWYAAFTGNGVWRSTGGGAAGTWSQLHGGLPSSNIGRVALAVTAANPARVYAAYGAVNGAALGIWTSTDSGASWSALPYANFCAYPDGSGNQCGYDIAIDGYPANQNYVYVGGIRVMRFDGSAWTTLGYNSSNGLHVDIHSVNFDSQNRLWVGSDGGAYLKVGGTAAFTNLNQGLGITQFYPGTTGTATSLFLGGTQDNGNLQYASGTWSQFQTGDGGYTAYDSADQWRFHEYVNAEAYRTTAAGTQTCLFTTNSRNSGFCAKYAAEPSQFIAPFVQSPSNQRTLFLGTNRLWRTTSGGGSWAAVSPQYAGTVSAIAQSKSNGNVLYAAWTGNSTTAAFVGYTTDGGTTWHGTAALPNRFITDLQVKQSAPGVAWATVSGYNSGHVFLTQDYGAHWADISGNLPNAPANKVAVDSRYSPSRLYVATDVGVFWSTDGGSTWANTSVGLPNSVVMDIRVDPGTNTLIAATYGRGAFSAPVP